MPRLIVTCYVVFGCYLWETCTFLKGSGRADLGKKGDREGTGRRRARGDYRQDVIFEIVFLKIVSPTRLHSLRY